MSKLIYPGVVKDDWRILVTEIDEGVNVVNYRWFVPPEPGPNVEGLTDEYDVAVCMAEIEGRESPRLWKFLLKKGLKLYLCPWCDN